MTDNILKALARGEVPTVMVEEECKMLRDVLRRYMDEYPAFRGKPIGAPGSFARREQLRQKELEDDARRVLNGKGATS